MNIRIIRTVPWDGKMLSPGKPIPDDVPETVLMAWVRNGKATMEKPKVKADGG